MSDLQLFPALDPATEDALRASIRRFGVLVPVVHDQTGRTLDGHHRERIAAELGAPVEVIVVTVADDDEAREVAVTLNADRRQLTTEQRRAVVADLRAEGHSLRAIAGAVGVDKETIRKDIGKIGDPSTIPARVLRKGGGTYPAHRDPLPAAPGRGETPTVTEARRRFEADLAAAGGPGTDEGQRLLEHAGEEEARHLAEIAAEERGLAALATAPEVVQAVVEHRSAVALRDLLRIRQAIDPASVAGSLPFDDADAWRRECDALEAWIGEWRSALARPLHVVGGTR